MNGFMSATMALLGASLLGASTFAGAKAAPSRQEAETASDAVVVIGAIRQTGQAASMAKLVDGRVGTGIVAVRHMVDKGWLKSIPRNPTDAQPSGYAVPRTIGGTTVVGMRLVDDARMVCDEISRQMSGTWPAPVSDEVLAHEGCVVTSSGPIAYMMV